MRNLSKVLLCLSGIVLSSHGMAKSNTCKFEGGEVKVTYTGKTANVLVTLNSHGPLYKSCKVSDDEFGKLIDCNTGNRDFMLLMSKTGKPVTGGIMSKTLNLFADLNC